MKQVPKGNKGLSKLPKKVRNKMGYFKDGGTPTKKKNKPAATTRMSTKKQAGFSLATSPRFKTLAKKVDNGELTTAEAIDMLLPKELKGKERAEARVKLAQAIGSQNANRYIAETDQKLNEKHTKLRKKTKQTRKPGFAKGGMPKSFNTCPQCTSPTNCTFMRKCQNASK